MTRQESEARELAKYGHPCQICGFAICECPLFRICDRDNPRHPFQVRRKFLEAYYLSAFLDDLIGYDLEKT